MHLALIPQFDARSPQAGSGIPRALEGHAERLTVLPPCAPPRTTAAARKARARLAGTAFLRAPTERAAFERLLIRAHALVMPVRAEAFGCVFCEAAAYGIPSLTTRVGGAPDAGADGVSGLAFDARPDPAVVADALARLVGGPARYAALALSARRHDEQRLTWDVATGTVAARLRALA